jgi:PAS domain-containing protein
MSSQVEEMLGYPVDQWMKEPGLWPLIVHPDDRSRFVRDAIETPQLGYPALSEEIKIQHSAEFRRLALYFVVGLAASINWRQT